MIIYHDIFIRTSRAHCWRSLEWLQATNPQPILTTLLSWRGTRKGTIVECVYVVLDAFFAVLTALIPLPVSVGLLDPPRVVWRVKWLSWLILWGVKKPDVAEVK